MCLQDGLGVQGLDRGAGSCVPTIAWKLMSASFKKCNGLLLGYHVSLWGAGFRVVLVVKVRLSTLCYVLKA